MFKAIAGLDPTSALQNIYSVASLIYKQVQLVKANKEQCRRLVERVRIIESAIRGLDKIQDKSQYKEGLNDLLAGLNDALVLMKKFSTSSRWERWILKAGNYRDEFEELTDRLQKSTLQLNLGLAAQQIVNRELDKADQQADTNFIKENQTLIIDLNKAQLEDLQKVHLKQQEQQEVLQLQLAAIQAQLKVITESKSKATVADKYRIPYYDLVFEQLLAVGSFGKIYLGKWEDKTVVIKALEGKFTEAEEERFSREVAIMGRLSHPNITTFYGACLEEGYACLVMEYMEQGSLTQVLQQAITPEQEKSLSLDVAEGLLYLHSQNILHRDFKSANILVNAQGIAKITDFGLSKIEALSVKTTQERSKSLPWQAPECFKFNAVYTSASDIYSFGVVLWEILTRKAPTINPAQLREYPNMGGRQPLPHAPEALVQLIQQCWALEPSKRPDAKQVMTQIKAYQPRPASPTPEQYYQEGIAAEQRKDFLLAFQQYQKSADKGYVKAKTNVGNFYLTSSHAQIPQDKPKAFGYFLEAANQKHVRAMWNVASMLEYGDGIPKDVPKALTWYQQIVQIDANHTKAKLKCEELSALLKSGPQYQLQSFN